MAFLRWMSRPCAGGCRGNMLSVGSLSVVAILSFVLGKIWSSSEMIFRARQQAYESFLKECVHYGELDFPGYDACTLDLPKLREVSALITLYSSRAAGLATDKYMYALGYQLGLGAVDDKQRAAAKQATATAHTEMIMSMRNDTLGWTYFGISSKVGNWRRRKDEGRTIP